MKKFFKSFLDEVRGFCFVIGLRTDAQCIAIGISLAIGLLFACGLGEAIERL